MIDDADLLRQYAQTNSEEAFRELVRRHVNLVYSAALRRVGNDAQTAEEITQSVFTVLARKAPTLLQHPALGGWLHRCTRYTAASVAREHQRRELFKEEVNRMTPQTDAHGADKTGWKNIGPIVDSLLDELGERERDAIILRFFEGRSFAEIGAALRLTEDAARMRVNRALDRLRELFAKRGIISSAGALGLALANHATLAAPAELAGATTDVALATAIVSKTGWLGATSFLHYMNATKTMVVIASVVGLVGGSIAVLQTRSLNDARNSAAAIAQERDAAARQLKELSAKVAWLEKENGEVRATRDALAAAQTPPPASQLETQNTLPLGSVVPPAVSMGLPGVDFNNATTRALVIQDRALRARARYQQLFRTLGLSASQQDQFIKNLSEQDEGMIDLALTLQGMTPSPAAETKMKEIGRQIFSDLNAKMQDLLGPEGAKKYAQYSNELRARPIVDQVATQLYDGSTPLSIEQANQLAQILNENRLGNIRGAADPSNSMQGTKVEVTAILLIRLSRSEFIEDNFSPKPFNGEVRV